jgi:hypothetical protein
MSDRFSIVGTDTKEHLRTLLRWLYHESISSGGDGDGIWYSQFYNISDLYPIVVELNKELGNFWEVHLQGKSIHWTREQEGIYITNDEEMWKNRPSWQQVSIQY